jgi:hypothetical protein
LEIPNFTTAAPHSSIMELEKKDNELKEQKLFTAAMKGEMNRIFCSSFIELLVSQGSKKFYNQAMIIY